ncbi:hypothetical protein G7939_16900 [Ralstonia solanacearum]|uniref:hypothetical protein n=1 Tax=Ralstonia pseudosolanacearum TaxID=1310165 RepID=UPI000B5E9C9A|nr:hypothetical protein [Ralstonia pseudosolanacearum]QIK24951.1 hypothetical protein G7939_16900 [Ralstonia solanacearum]ASL73565.1 hypothetical protein BC350_07880 [Ralstonia pseudosolanacearum]MCK4120626.1 hypothetical protein [Ralstonia pseudosolanacearum]MCK4155440.1 hypothetical protein [Ralstonia pseudosolanacearum]QIK27013.1 hypothetical protein G7947_00920 [Ralstonia solanacearum]
MQINRKTRNIAKYLNHLQPSELYMLGLALNADIEKRLEELGFNSPLIPGQSLLPPARKGPACRRNAEGYDIVHRDRPMETMYRQVEWHWAQFVGRHGTKEMSKIVDVPYQRYPRTHVAPYSTELEIKVRDDGKVFVLAGPFANDEDHIAIATNTANMLREALGGFEVLGKDLSDWVSAPVRRLHWQLLPPGKNPWESAQPALNEMVERAPAGNQSVLRARLAAVGEKKPDFVAIGIGGFEGYTVFGFVKQGLCVLESPQVNNATYVLPMESWEAVSQMTKAQILDAQAHKARIVHTRSWFDALEEVLSAGRKAA